MSTELTRPDPTADDKAEEIARLRAKVLRLGNVLGAAAGMLNAIHRAGGYHVFDPAHQERVGAAMRALEESVVEAMP